MSEIPPGKDHSDIVDATYRQASALDPSRPSESVRRNVLAHAEQLARSYAGEVAAVASSDGTRRRSQHSWWRRPAVFGTLIAAAVAGIWVAPQIFLSHGRGTPNSTLVTSASRPEAESLPAPPPSPSMPLTATPAAPAAPTRMASPQAALAPTAPAPAAPAPATPAPATPAATPSTTAGETLSYQEPRESMANAAQGHTETSTSDTQPSAKVAKKSADAAEAEDKARTPSALSAGAALQARAFASASRAATRASPNTAQQPTPTPSDAVSTLWRAATTGDVQALQTSIAARVDVNARDAEGRTALMLATLHGQMVAVNVLLEHGADPNLADSQGITPLQAAVNAAQPAIAAALQRAGAR